MKVKFPFLPIATLSAFSLFADNRTMSFNAEVQVLPSPGPVTIDGSVDDWDLSAGVWSYNDPQIAARHSVWTHLMRDAKGVYVLCRYRDETPFVNATKGIDFATSWRGDCCQARVIFDDGTPDEHQMHIDMYYSRPSERGYMIARHGGLRDRAPYDETGPSRSDQQAKWGTDMTEKGGRIAFKAWPDGKGYDMEAFWPWSFVRTSGRPLAVGESFTLGLEAVWGDSVGSGPAHRLADLIRDENVNRIFMFCARGGWGRAVIAAKGGSDITSRQKALHAERLGHFLDYGTRGSVKIPYELPEERDVTIAIDDASGLRVRHLFGQYPRVKGAVTDFWDCRDDDGNPVKPGDYTASVVHHRPFALTYRNSLYNAATPPWRTDGPFRLWGANHGYPTSVATDGRHTVILFTGTEGMSGMQLIDDNGRVLWSDVNEFVDGTLDDTYVYGLSRSGWQNVILLQRNRISDGKVEPWEDENRLPAQTIVKTGWERATDYSSLALAHGRLWALMPGFRFVVADPKTGLPIRATDDDGAFAALTDRNGKLFALTADGRVVTLDADGKVASEVFRADGVTRGVRLGVDLAERRFAITDAATNQVLVFDPSGRRLGSVGRAFAGEQRPAGAFVETDLIRPIGADFDRLGRLWVAEGLNNCKRVTCWNRDLGLVDQYWGAADYGAMSAFPIVADASRFIAHGVEFALDPAPDPLHRKTNERPLVNQPFLAPTRGLVHRLNGRDYACAAPGFGNAKRLEIFLRDDDRVFRPIVRLDLCQRVNRGGTWVETPGSAWVDLNGNHCEDAGETVRVDLHGTYWANGYVRPDLAILTTDSKLFVPTGFTSAGVPLYDFAHPATTGDGSPYRQARNGTGTPVIDRAGNVSDGIRFFAKDGRHGHYPNRWGRHDAPAARRGELIAPFRVNGVVEDVPGVGAALAIGGDRGQWFILSTDGLYLGAILQDTKGEVSLDETFIGQEAFGGFFWRDGASGKPLVQIGHSCYAILELAGLETVVREQVPLRVTEADLAESDRILRMASPARAVEASELVVAAVPALPAKAVPVGLGADHPLIPGAADVTVSEEGNAARCFRAALAHDATELAMAFQVKDPSPWRNAEGRFTHLFIGGDAVDLKLDVPGVGPVRLLAAPLDGKPTAVLWRKTATDASSPMTYSVENNLANAERFDLVRRLDSARIDVAVGADAYTILVRVPLSEIAPDGLTPGKMSGTVGVIYSNPAGNNRVSRLYWHDKQTGLVSDVPSESRLNLKGFGPVSWAGAVGAGVVERPDGCPRDVVARAGQLSVICPNREGWRFALTRVSATRVSATNDLEELELMLDHDGEALPPSFTVEVRSCVPDRSFRWTFPFGCAGRTPQAAWTGWCGVQRSIPIVARFDGSDRNRLTLAVDAVRDDLTVATGFDESDFACLDRIAFFGGVRNPRAAYTVRIRLDRRDVFWSDAVAAAARWIDGRCEPRPCLNAPAGAYRPLYSTWYNFHHDVHAARLERELAAAAELGLETVILDDGWASDGESVGYAMCGDWEMSKVRFPDMAAHVKRVQALGLKYMMWYAVPFVGLETKAARRFAGKFLYVDGNIGAACLDPRFPDVRDYLTDVWEKALLTWGLDGLKLDFIDQIEVRDRADPAVAEAFAGRDCRTVPEGVEKLMRTAAERLRAVKPDVLIEYRSAYVGPVMQRCANMMRVADCPGDPAANRVGTVNLRLVCPQSAVHGDMIRWPADATPEEAARAVLSSVFGAVQYSVILEGLDARMTQMLRHWISFCKVHERALQKGSLRPHHPEADYPVVEGWDDAERMILVSSAGFVADVDADRPACVLNNTGTDEILLRCAAPCTAEIVDTFGTAHGTVSVPAGMSALKLPVSGYARLSFARDMSAFGATLGDGAVTAVADARGELRFGYERRIDGWEEDAYVLLPAAAYDGNRLFRPTAPVSPDYGAWYRPSDFSSRRCPYALHEKVPVLAPDGSGVLEGAAGDLSTPCAAFFLPRAKKGVVFWFQPQLRGRDAGYRFENGTLRISYPARRKELLFKASSEADPPIVCTPGERVRVAYRLDEFPCASVAELYAAFFARRSSFVSAPRAPLPDAAERRRLATLVARRMVDDSIRAVPDQGLTWSAGWCGGPMNIAALANVGWTNVAALAASTLDFLAAHQSPCGLFRGLSRDGREVPERPSHPDSVGLHLTRRSADALFYAVPLLDLAGATPGRERALRRCADALVTVFEREGELPQYVDQRTGESRIAGSTSAALAPAALVRMANRFGERRYRDAAARIATQMCETYLAKGLCFGGPGDAADACDSESTYALLESCVSLAEAGVDRETWIRWAETAAHVLSTWIVPYRYEFPPDSEYGRRGVTTVGSVIANLQNRHAAPGFCTASGDALSRLADLTGERAYRALYEDTVAFLPQVVATPERPITARLWTDRPLPLDPGAMNERVNMSGWEGLEGVGEVFPGPCWSELCYLLVPGITEERLK